VLEYWGSDNEKDSDSEYGMTNLSGNVAANIIDK